MTIISLEEELRKVLSLFKGQTCWNVCSCIMGHSLQLHFGKAMEEIDHYPKRNPPTRRFRGQYQLTFLCSWRLDDENHNPFLSCDWWSEHHKIKTTAISLIGETIESIEITPPVWEMTVFFSSGKQLRAFCDCVPDSKDMDGWMNWWCETEEDSYHVGPGKRIEKYRRSDLVSNTLYDPEEVDPKFISSDKNYKPEEEGGGRRYLEGWEIMKIAEEISGGDK